MDDRLDSETCYRALTARDGRFDGLFFVGVKTTGIYCRPVCRARTPARDRCVFYRLAPEAERDGFRACFRCRPELAPGNAPMDSVPRLVERAVACIETGFLADHRVSDLAAALGVTDRHLRRALAAEIGISPIELVQSRRLALAKQLLQDTTLPLVQVAFESGFASVRRFNALFRARFGRPPSTLRRDHGPPARPGGDSIVLRLDHRPPLDWDALLAFLAGRAVPGVESVSNGVYRRTVSIAGRDGWVAVQRAPREPSLRAEVSLTLSGVLIPLVARLRALFDLDAQPAVVSAHLARDPMLADIVRRHPGLRVPGAFDGFEIAVRAVLGQQVSVRAARTLAGRLARDLGRPVATPFPDLDRLFPEPGAVDAAGEAGVARVGLPAARAHALCALARAVAEGRIRPERSASVPSTLTQLRALPGIGEWTASYVAMRALGWPDAFPAGDLGLRRATGCRTARSLERRAERWRPWRAYAALFLWTSLASIPSSGAIP